MRTTDLDAIRPIANADLEFRNAARFWTTTVRPRPKSLAIGGPNAEDSIRQRQERRKMTTIDAPEVSWEEAMRRERFWNDNYEWLLANYREQYVAVDPNDGSVVASNEELVFLINELKRCGFHPPRDVAVRLVSDRFHTMIL